MNATVETWLPVVGHEGWYEVSSFGQVRRCRPGKATSVGRLLKQRVGKTKRVNVSLSRESVQTTYDVHRIVAIAFLGPVPPGKEVNHIDYDYLNNRADNLEYVTRAENMSHAYAHGLKRCHGEAHWMAKLTDRDVEMIRNSPLGNSAIALHYGISRTTVKRIRAGEGWKHVVGE